MGTALPGEGKPSRAFVVICRMSLVEDLALTQTSDTAMQTQSIGHMN